MSKDPNQRQPPDPPDTISHVTASFEGTTSQLNQRKKPTTGGGGKTQIPTNEHRNQISNTIKETYF